MVLTVLAFGYCCSRVSVMHRAECSFAAIGAESSKRLRIEPSNLARRLDCRGCLGIDNYPMTLLN
jgi:hypothetical protein